MNGSFGDTFGFGFIAGILFILILTPFFFWLGIWRKKFLAIFRPQKIILKTKKSPAQVFWDALLGFFWGLFIGIITILVLIIVYILL